MHLQCQHESRIHREIRERNRALAHGAHYDRFMRWVIACASLALGCRSTHVSELPLVHDIRPAPSGLVVYWLLSNVLAIGQQYVTNRMIGAPVPAVARARSKAVTRASAGRK